MFGWTVSQHRYGGRLRNKTATPRQRCQPETNAKLGMRCANQNGLTLTHFANGEAGNNNRMATQCLLKPKLQCAQLRRDLRVLEVK